MDGYFCYIRDILNVNKKTHHRFNICGFSFILSMTCCGMQNTGLTALMVCVSSSASQWPSMERPARPNRVWKGSGRSPGRSEMPPGFDFYPFNGNCFCQHLKFNSLSSGETGHRDAEVGLFIIDIARVRFSLQHEATKWSPDQRTEHPPVSSSCDARMYLTILSLSIQ